MKSDPAERMNLATTPLKLPFGLRDGQLTHIADVSSGKACGCLCPSCNAPLVAKKGPEIAHHFAHASGADCGYAVETALHIAAKDAIVRAGYFVTPPVHVDFDSYKRPWLLAEARRLVPDSVTLEVRMGEVVPDVVLAVGSRRLLVEVAVTHFVDETKRQRLVSVGLSTIEVDLDALARDASPSVIAAAVVDGVDQKRWIFNARADRERRKVREVAAQLRIVRRGFAVHADGCPLPARQWKGKPYANVIDDCLNCEFCVDSGLGDEEGGAPLLCLGRHRISTIEDWGRASGRGMRRPASVD